MDTTHSHRRASLDRGDMAYSWSPRGRLISSRISLACQTCSPTNGREQPHRSTRGAGGRSLRTGRPTVYPSGRWSARNRSAVAFSTSHVGTDGAETSRSASPGGGFSSEAAACRGDLGRAPGVGGMPCSDASPQVRRYTIRRRLRLGRSSYARHRGLMVTPAIAARRRLRKSTAAGGYAIIGATTAMIITARRARAPRDPPGWRLRHRGSGI